MNTDRGGGSSSVLRKQFAAALPVIGSSKSSASSSIATLHLPRADFKLNPRHSSRITSIGKLGLSGGRAAVKKSGCDSASTSRHAAHLSHASSRPLFVDS